MKVLIATGVFPPESGGPATYSKTLLDELPNHGIEVTVVPFRDVRKIPNVFRQIVYAGIVLWRGRKFDILYAQDTMSVGWPTCFANFFLRKTFLVRVPGDHVWEQATQRFGTKEVLDDFPLWSQTWHPYLVLLRTLQQITVRHADRIVVPSKYLGRIVQKWKVPKKRIVVIYNGIAPESVGLKQVIRGLLRFKGKLIVTSGRLVPWKGNDVLLRIHARLQKKHHDLSFLIIGSGPEQQHLEQLAKELGTTDTVIFTGALEKPVAMRYMRAGDVFVLNTHYEGFSHVLLEAASIGIPIVTTKIGGNPEFIDDNINGYLVKPDDEQALLHRIEKLLTSPETRARISGNAKKRVASFSNEKMVGETADLLKNI